MTIETIVCLGPSLPIEEAQKILPNAAYHAPIQCGDIIKMLRLRPKTIVIIDGLFEQTAAVWHKEILLALSLGIQVYGASSMGALRAAELAPYGMIGVGQIFEWYRDAVIIDDDEVALVHTEDASFRTRLTPMVNVRVTLSSAVNAGVISSLQAEVLLSEIKAQPYYNRSLFEEAKKNLSLAVWLNEHYIDQKQLDAKQVLKRVADQDMVKRVTPNPTVLSSSVFLKRLFREMIVSPFEPEYAWLPQAEKKYTQLCTNPLFPTIQRIGKLLHILHDMIRHDSIVLPRGKTQIDSIITWAKDQPWQLPEERLSKHLLIYSNWSLYPSDASSIKTLDLLTILSNALIFLLKNHGSQFTSAALLSFITEFRQKHALIKTDQVLKWMKQNGLEDLETFECFALDMSFMHYFVDHHQLDALGVDTDLTQFFWGIDVLQYVL